MLITYATFTGVLDKKPEGRIEQWGVFDRRFTRHQVQPANADGKQAKGGLWSPTLYKAGTTRAAANVELVTCFVADVDDGTPYGELWERWEGLRFVLHSSFSSTPNHPKWRVVFPLKTPVTSSEWGVVWKKLNEHLMGGHCDKATKDPSRIYYWPSAPAERLEQAFVASEDGEVLDHTLYADIEQPQVTPRSVASELRHVSVSSAVGVSGGIVVSGDELLGKYVGMARPGERNRTAFDLGCQLRDNGFSAGECLDYLERFKAAMGRGFDDDMNHIWEQVSARAPRDSWTPKGQTVKPQLGTSRTQGGQGFDIEQSSASYISDKWTDVGNKDRFLRHFADQVRYDPSRGWMVWDGRRWGQDVDGGQVMNFAVMVARSLYSEEEPSDEKQCQLWRQFVKSTNQVGKIRAFVELAKCDPAIRVYADVWDADPWVLNCANGILDLRTGELGEHDPLVYCTYITRAAYQKGAKSELWTRCLAQWQPIEAKRSYLQRHAGYDLTGSTREQTAVFHFGDGSNGKTIYTGTQEWIMGDYAARVPMAVLVDDKPRGGQASPDVARLAGRRLVIASEITSARGLNESIIKDLTGGDTLTARFLNANPFEFRPSFKLVFFGNHKPQIRNQDDGIWRRLPLVEWATKIEEGQKDKNLLQKLQSEEDMSGILSWMVEGCLAWQESGLATPEEVQESSNSYRAEQDQIGKFLGECCVLGEGFFCPTKTLRAAYERWCEDNGEKWQASPNQFAERLRRAGAAPSATPRRVNGTLVRGWEGVGVTSERDDESGVTESIDGKESPLIANDNLFRPATPTTVTPVTPEKHISSHVRAHTHGKLLHSGVTGVTEAAEEGGGVAKKPPGDTPQAPPAPANRSDQVAVRAWEKELIAWFRIIVASGAVEATSPPQAALWLELEAEYNHLASLPAQEGKAQAPGLKKRMLSMVHWWRSLETFPQPGGATGKKGRGQ